MKYRPRMIVIYTYAISPYQATIACYPQSRWELLYRTSDVVALSKKNVTIRLSVEDFEKRWVEVE